MRQHYRRQSPLMSGDAIHPRHLPYRPALLEATIGISEFDRPLVLYPAFYTDSDGNEGWRNPNIKTQRVVTGGASFDLSMMAEVHAIDLGSFADLKFNDKVEWWEGSDPARPYPAVRLIQQITGMEAVGGSVTLTTEKVPVREVPMLYGGDPGDVNPLTIVDVQDSSGGWYTTPDPEENPNHRSIYVEGNANALFSFVSEIWIDPLYDGD